MLSISKNTFIAPRIIPINNVNITDNNMIYLSLLKIWTVFLLFFKIPIDETKGIIVEIPIIGLDGIHKTPKIIPKIKSLDVEIYF